MIETFLIDWPVLTILGFAFGAFAPQQRWWRSRAFFAGSASAAVFTLVALVSYLVAPDWMWMYFLDPAGVSWAVPLILLAYLGVYVIAFASAVALSSVGRKLVWAGVAASLLVELALVAITWDRYHLIGTREQWLKDAAHELLTATPTGPARTISLLGPVFMAALALSAVAVWRARRASQPRAG